MERPFEVEVQPVGGPPGRRSGRRLLPAVLLIAALGLAAGLLIETNTIRLDRAPVPVRHANRIAFVDNAGGLNTIGADGSNRRTYEMSGTTFQFPAWSPDGNRIAAIGSDPSEAAIYIFDDASGAAAATASPIVAYGPSLNGPIYLSWSPDGQRISFITNEGVDLALQTVVADGTGVPAILRRGQPMYWAWVDDAHVLVHSGGNAPDAFVGEVGLDASTATPVGGAIGQFQAPGVSSSGDYRAYVVATATGAAQVVVEGRHGSTRFQASVAGASSLGWSPSGNLLAYTAPAQSNDVPVGALRLIDASSGTTRSLLDGLVFAYFWAPDARTIAALRLVSGGGQTAAVGAIEPAATAVSMRLAFVDVATGAIRAERAVQLPDLVLNQFVPFFDQYALSHRLWSPAGDAIVLPLVDDAGQPHVTIVPDDGSAPRQLADGVSAFWSP